MDNYKDCVVCHFPVDWKNGQKICEDCEEIHGPLIAKPVQMEVNQFIDAMHRRDTLGRMDQP